VCAKKDKDVDVKISWDGIVAVSWDGIVTEHSWLNNVQRHHRHQQKEIDNPCLQLRLQTGKWRHHSVRIAFG